MKLSNTKWLKRIGIIILVVGVLLLGVWGLISILNKEKVYLNAFAGDIEAEIDTKKEAFTKVNNKNATLGEYASTRLEMRTLENKNLTENIKYIQNYFSVVGLNSSERAKIDKIVSNIQGYRTSLESIYKNLNDMAEGTLIPEDFKKVFDESYLTNLDLIINQKLDLFNFLNEILAKHNIVETDYIKSVQSLSLTTISVIQKLNIPHLKTYGKKEASYNTSKALITKLNENLEKINNNTKDYSNSNLDALISDLSTETKNFAEKTNAFINSYNALSKLEADALSQGGSGFDYTITPDTENLTKVINFLKSDGEFAGFASSSGKIMLGINL